MSTPVEKLWATVWPEGIPTEDYGKALRIIEAMHDVVRITKTARAPRQLSERRLRLPKGRKGAKLDRNQVVAWLRAEPNKTTPEIAERFGVSRARVSSLMWMLVKQKALRRENGANARVPKYSAP